MELWLKAWIRVCYKSIAPYMNLNIVLGNVVIRYERKHDEKVSIRPGFYLYSLFCKRAIR